MFLSFSKVAKSVRGSVQLLLNLQHYKIASMTHIQLVFQKIHVKQRLFTRTTQHKIHMQADNLKRLALLKVCMAHICPSIRTLGCRFIFITYEPATKYSSFSPMLLLDWALILLTSKPYI